MQLRRSTGQSKIYLFMSFRRRTGQSKTESYSRNFGQELDKAKLIHVISDKNWTRQNLVIHVTSEKYWTKQNIFIHVISEKNWTKQS